MMKNIKAVREQQFGKEIITLHFAYEKESLEYIKNLKDSKYSGSLKCWYIPYTEENALKFGIKKDFTKSLRKNGKGVNEKAMQAFLEAIMTSDFEENSQKTYVNEFTQFLKNNKEKDVSRFTQNDIVKFLLDSIEKRNISAPSLFSLLNTIKYYYEIVLEKKDYLLLIPKPKRQRKTDTLSPAEIHLIENNFKKDKYILIAKLVLEYYIDISDLIHIKIENVDIEASLLSLPQRTVPLKKDIINLLRNYALPLHHQSYLFVNRQGTVYSVRMIQSLLQKAMTECGIDKNIGKYSQAIDYRTLLQQLRLE